MTLEQLLEQIGGCGDGNCKVYVRPGQHTNGGCRCLRHDPIKAERVISAYRAEVDRLTAQLAEAEADHAYALNSATFEIEDLRRQLAEAERGLKYEQHRAGRQGTHGTGCYTWGPAHYECALAQLAEREAECFKLAAGVCGYRSGDDHGNPLCLMVRKPIPPNMCPVTVLKEPKNG